MMHISQHQEDPATLRLHLEGILDGVHAAALRDVVVEASERGIVRLVIDCGGLTGVDDAGARLLADLRLRDASFLELPVTVSWKLAQSESQSLNRA